MSREKLINQSTSALINYTLHLADNALILGHRNSEWCGHGPLLEQDIAITNISLDLIAQARNFYQYAATLMNVQKISSPAGGEDVEGATTEDTLAYLRDNREFKNCLLVEQPNGDWAKTIMRQFLFSTYQFYLYEQLSNSKDQELAGIAEKSLKEVTYHVRWSSEWVIRLGDGTDESRKRMTHALTELWRYTGEMFMPADYEKESGYDFNLIRDKWLERITIVFMEAGLSIPDKTFMQTG